MPFNVFFSFYYIITIIFCPFTLTVVNCSTFFLDSNLVVEKVKHLVFILFNDSTINFHLVIFYFMEFNWK